MLLEGQQALDGDHEILARQSHRLGKISGVVGICRWSRISPSQLTRQTDHGPGMPIDATVGFVHSGVKSPSPSSSAPIAVCMMSLPDGEVEEEVSIRTSTATEVIRERSSWEAASSGGMGRPYTSAKTPLRSGT
jgi:hypothetical protein